MAKRYTDTDKWKKDFMKSLPIEYKTFFLYLCDECDHAGIWHVEMEIVAARLGASLSKEKALKLYKGRVFEFDNGTKWLVLDFIIFQYGVLKEANKVHASVLDRLNKYNLLGTIKGLPSSLQGAKDNDKDNDNDIVIGGVGDFSSSMPVKKPVFEDVHALFVRNGKTEAEARTFYNHYEGLGWMKGITPILNWTSIANNWIANPLPGRNQSATPIKTTDTNEWSKLAKDGTKH